MDLYQLRWALLKIMAVAVIGSSWVFWSFIFETRPPEESNGGNALSSLVRLPASLPTQLPERLPGVFSAPVKAQEPVRMDVVRVPCWDRAAAPRDVGLGSRWVRLVGRTCEETPAEAEDGASAGSRRITVRNLSNGYIATVFDAQKGLMTTDFIPLENGRNEILIRFDHGAEVAVENRFVLSR